LSVLLHIETSNTVCSVCLSKNGEAIALRENTEGNLHASLLTPFIEQVMAEAAISYNQLDALSLSLGPGSYTGLRIGASAAKAICYATGKPLIAITTLQAMAAGYIKQHGAPEAGTLPSARNVARRLEVYTALYNTHLEELLPPQPWIVLPQDHTPLPEAPQEDFFGAHINSPKIVCFGNGALKLGPHLKQENLVFDGNNYISSLNLVSIALRKFELGDFTDVAYFEPYYLKTTPVPQSK